MSLEAPSLLLFAADCSSNWSGYHQIDLSRYVLHRRLAREDEIEVCYYDDITLQSTKWMVDDLTIRVSLKPPPAALFLNKGIGPYPFCSWALSDKWTLEGDTFDGEPIWHRDGNTSDKIKWSPCCFNTCGPKVWTINGTACCDKSIMWNPNYNYGVPPASCWFPSSGACVFLPVALPCCLFPYLHFCCFRLEYG